VHGLALLLGHLVALLVGLIGALFLGNSCALLLWNVDALLAGNLVAVLIGNLSLLLLRDILAGIIGIRLAGTWDGNPDLGGTLPLPVVLTVVLVVCITLCLRVLLVLGPVLCVAHLVVHRIALSVLNGPTLLLGYVHALWPGEGLALLDGDGGALLLLGLSVLGVPDGGVLRPTLDTRGRGCWSSSWDTSSSSTILWCSEAGSDQTKNEKEFHGST